MCLGWISSQKWLKSNHLHPALQLIEESSHPELAARKVILTQHLIFIKVLVHVRDPLLRELKLWMRRRSKMWACGIQMSPNSLKFFLCLPSMEGMQNRLFSARTLAICPAFLGVWQPREGVSSTWACRCLTESSLGYFMQFMEAVN